MKHLKNFSKFIYALFFTRDDDLDVLQLLFTAIVVITLLIVWNVAVVLTSEESVKIEALVTLRWLTGLLVVTAVPKWLVPTIVSMKSSLSEEIRPKRDRWKRHEIENSLDDDEVQVIPVKDIEEIPREV